MKEIVTMASISIVDNFFHHRKRIIFCMGLSVIEKGQTVDILLAWETNGRYSDYLDRIKRILLLYNTSYQTLQKCSYMYHRHELELTFVGCFNSKNDIHSFLLNKIFRLPYITCNLYLFKLCLCWVKLLGSSKLIRSSEVY